jgi:4-amino-4-deoxy-L-arabinose transferase-like glycosyltransferase
MPPSPLRPLLLLLALVASLLAFRLGAVPLIGPDEPRYARVAVEMSRSGDLVTPTLQGRPWLEKPALYYWLAAGACRLLGETELAARLPSLLAALVMVAGTVAVGSRIYGPAAGLHAGFVLGTSVLTFGYGRAASMDMLLAATVTLAIGLATLRVLQRAGPGAMVAAWAFAALATLAKGPLGLLLPLLVVGSFVAFLGGRRVAREVLSLRGVLLFSAVALPWYTLVLLRERWTFVEVFLLNHNVQRFTSTVHNHPGTIAYYVPILLIGLAPWSGLLLPAVLRLEPRASLADRALLLWFLLPLVFFSAAGSKLPGYVLPCLPPLAILMGREADRLVRGEAPGPLGSGGRAVAILGLVVASAVFAAPAVLWKQAEPAWQALVPVALWGVVVAYLFARRLPADAAGAFALLRVGAAGLLLLATLAVPELLARRESGRDLFRAAAGREVLAWGAWRTAWMAGYFYNDGRVREIEGWSAVAEAVEHGPALVLCGPGERRWLDGARGVSVREIARGPRGNVLVEIRLRRDASAEASSPA